MFYNKVCVITGGANGIGRYLVKTFAEQGSYVAFMDKDREAGDTLMETISREGDAHLFCHGDVGREEDLRDFTEKVILKYGRVDYLINNACFSHKGLRSECSFEAFNEVLRVGVTAPYFLTLLLKDKFVEGASIVNISSTRAFMSQADTESYSAAKGGITALTHAMAVSLSGKARVNAISPGWIDTTGEDKLSEEDRFQHPSQRVGKPQDIARAVLFLCDEHSDFINGENITIDGGMSRRMIYHGDEGWTYEGKNN